MPAKPVPKKTLRLVAKLYREENGVAAVVARRLGKPEPTIRGQIGMIRTTNPEWLELPPAPDPKVKPKEKPKEAPPREAKHDVALERATRTQRETEARNRDLRRLVVELQDKIETLSWVAEASYTPADWATPARTAKRSEHMPYLLTSDFQCGEVVKADETEAGYGYDSGIFVARYRHLIDTAIYLSKEHVGHDWLFPGFIYARGGDAISGQLHLELMETDDITPLEAVQLVAEEEMGGIRKLAEAFGRVEVKSIGAGGNHGRDLLKPTTKRAVGHNYDQLIEYMLRREFAKDKRVTFQTSRSFDTRYPIYGQKIILTHGDRIGSRGGQGFIGPAATIMRGVQKVFQEQSALGFHVDQVHLGHFHYPLVLPQVIANGSLPGYTEYAKNFRMRPNPPQQMLCYFHPRRGIVDYKPIILTDIK